MPFSQPAFANRRLSAHVGFLFTELPFAARFDAARDAGFRAVEHPSPFAMPAAQLARHLSGAGLTFVQTGFPAGDAARGEKGFAALPAHVEAFRASIAPTLDYVEEIGCRLVHAMAGVRPAGVPQNRLWDTYLENLSYAADAAAKRGIGILIEPIGPGSVADYVLDDPALAVAAITELRRDNIRLLLDVYHCISLDRDPIPLIQAHAPLIGHVQIADHPGRHEPGSGAVDFAPILAALDAAGYAGCIGCEYHPAGTTRDSLAWMPAARSAS